MTDQYEEEKLEESSLLSHLLELRSRLLKAFVAVIVCFAILVPFARQVFTFVAKPMQNALPVSNTMIATDPASSVFAPFKLAFFVAIFLAMPYILYQVWAFVAPGLYKKEKRFTVPLLASSILLFYAGIAFAYYVVFPLIFTFFVTFAPDGIENMTDISSYLSFVLTLFLAFGIAFEVPIATVLLCWAGLTSPQKLASIRAYVFLGCFVVGMFLTPPDVFSQALLAIPVYMLFEAGIVMARLTVSKPKDDTEEQAVQTSEETEA